MVFIEIRFLYVNWPQFVSRVVASVSGSKTSDSICSTKQAKNSSGIISSTKIKMEEDKDQLLKRGKT